MTSLDEKKRGKFRLFFQEFATLAGRAKAARMAAELVPTLRQLVPNCSIFEKSRKKSIFFSAKSLNNLRPR